MRAFHSTWFMSLAPVRTSVMYAGVHFLDAALHLSEQERRITRASHVEGCAASGILTQRQVDGRLRCFAQGRVVAGFYYADDLAFDGVARKAEMISDRIALRPVSTRQIFVDDDDGRDPS